MAMVMVYKLLALRHYLIPLDESIGYTPSPANQGGLTIHKILH
jgi:hypothetical protein